MYGREVCTDLLKRAFLSNVPVPRKTRVLVVDGDKTIGRGDNVRLEAFADGVIPKDGKVELKYASRRTQEFTVQQNETNPAHFGRTIENVQETFTYVIHLNDGSSKRHTVTALPRPSVKLIECTQVYPAYTQAPSTRRHLGDLTILAGSQLQLRVETTKDIQQAAVRLVGLDRNVALQVSETNQTILHGTFTVPPEKLSGFSILLQDTQGMESRDSAVYRVEVIPDKAPRVRIVEPARKEVLITRDGTLPIRMAVKDDYFIGKVALKFKVDTDETQTIQTLEMELDGQTPAQMDRTYLWEMVRFQPRLESGALIEFWLEAEDTNDATGPGQGRSDPQLARVVTAEEKQTELLNRAGDILSGIEDVAEDQERANKGLGTLILDKGRQEP